jgi:GTP-binding protein LepA
LRIIGAVNKIDLNPATLDDVILELANLLDVDPGEIFKVSGRTGVGAEELLEAVIEKLPPPKHAIEESSKPAGDDFQALIFDSRYDDHKGALAYVRVMNGKIGRGGETELAMAHTKFKVKEVGHFSPGFVVADEVSFGEIGYIATGIKDPDLIKIGDTVGNPPLPGYKEPKPVVFVSFYPNEDGEYENLKLALRRFKLNDPALTFESDFNEVLGRGFKCGFLGQLHFEVTSERLEKEYHIETINSFPSVAYKVKHRGEWKIIENPKDFPDDYEEVWQPMVRLEILTMPEHLGSVLKLKEMFAMDGLETKTMGARMLITARMPLADLVRDFDDRLKSVSGGYASFTYELMDQERAEVTKLEIVVANDSVPGLLRIVNKKDVEYEGRQMVEKLKDLLPRQQFAQALQAKAMGRIIARETIPALKKDVTGYLYGGDRSRKIKLWEKQKRGKERLKKMGRVELSPDVFKELLKKQK